MITREGIGKYVKRVYVLIQIASIALMCLLFLAGFIDIAISLVKFQSGYIFLRDLLHSLEILFIAPIPLLIVFSFRKHIILSFPGKLESATPNELEKLFDSIINEAAAKKSFISSIIGVMSTYLLGIFIKLLTPAEDQVNAGLSLSHDFILGLFFYLAFMLIMILLYHLISNHKNE